MGSRCANSGRIFDSSRRTEVRRQNDVFDGLYERTPRRFDDVGVDADRAEARVVEAMLDENQHLGCGAVGRIHDAHAVVGELHRPEHGKSGS